MKSCIRRDNPILRCMCVASCKRGRRRRRTKECWIVQVALCRHYGVCTSSCETHLDVGMKQDVAIGNDGHADRLFHSSDFLPVSKALSRRFRNTVRMPVDPKRMRGTNSMVPSLLSSSPMAGEHLCASSFEHLGVLHCFLGGWEDAEFGSDGNREILMQSVDCEYSNYEFLT